MSTTVNVNENAGVNFARVELADITSDLEITLTQDASGIVTFSDPVNTVLAAGDAVQNGSEVNSSTSVNRLRVDLGSGSNALTAQSVTADMIVSNSNNGYAVIKTGAGNDEISGGSGKDKIEGGAGLDTLDGGGGSDDTVEYTSSDAGVNVNLTTNSASGGHAENDTIANFENISGSAFADTLIGDAGNNMLRGRLGNDLLVGGDGGDRLYGDAGNDDLRGGAGKDFIYAGTGSDTIDGGDGEDTVFYADSRTRVIVRLETGVGGLGAQGDTFSNIENVSGSANGDFLSGNDQSNSLMGEDGDDTLLGREGRDNLKGGAGNDTLTGGTNGDALTGGAGADTFVYSVASDSLLSDRDQIKDFNIGEDVIDSRFAVASGDIDKGLTVANFGEQAFADVLTEAVFEAETAAVVTLGSLTLLAINDGTAGFQADRDAVVDITGFTGDINALAIV